MIYKMDLDYGINLVAHYENDIVNGYVITSVTVNGSNVELTEDQKEELIEEIIVAEVYLEDEEETVHLDD
jgi:hypothetical protein